MSPRYKEVSIPADKSEAFRAFLKQIGGTHEGETFSDQEKRLLAAVEWKKQVALARDLLAQVAYPQDPRITTQLNQNFMRFMARAFSPPSQESSFIEIVRSDLDWPTVKDAVLTEIAICLPDQIPDTVDIIPTQYGGGFAFRMRRQFPSSPLPFSPRAVGAMILSHGLHSGQGLSDAQAAGILGSSKENYGKILKSGYESMRTNETIRGLVLENPSPKT